MQLGIIAIVFAALSLDPSLVFAGEHTEVKDEFNGEIFRHYHGTPTEVSKQEVMYMIMEYVEETKTVLFVVQPLSGATQCNDEYLQLKTASGEIHKIDAEEVNNTACKARIPAAWIVDHFTVRIPMFRGPTKDAKFSTSSLKLKLLK